MLSIHIVPPSGVSPMASMSRPIYFIIGLLIKFFSCKCRKLQYTIAASFAHPLTNKRPNQTPGTQVFFFQHFYKLVILLGFQSDVEERLLSFRRFDFRASHFSIWLFSCSLIL